MAQNNKMKKVVLSILISCFALATVNAQKVKGPSINFKKVVHDYGTIENGADGRCEFKFTNNGTEPLKITSCRASCGCTIPSWPREEILPGKSEIIKVKYDTKRTGGIHKTITIQSNAVDNPTKVLTIKGKINPPKSQASVKKLTPQPRPTPARPNTKPAVTPKKVVAPAAPAPPAEKVMVAKKRRWYQFWKKKN